MSVLRGVGLAKPHEFFCTCENSTWHQIFYLGNSGSKLQ